MNENNWLRRLINRSSYEQKTICLTRLRREIPKAGGIARFLKIRKYNNLLFFFNADIPIESEIGDGLVLPHGGNGIFISRGAKIGKNCVIFQQVTIGSNTLSDSRGHGAPTIGDNVYIGAGAKIIGNVIIGNNVRVGANTVVTKNIPDNCTVVSQASRIIVKKTLPENSFHSY